MSSGFDPYREWLNLDAATGKLDYYALLGLPRFEPDATVIMEAADRALARVRSHRPGPHAQAWAKLLDEIEAAKNCLTNDASRVDYDRTLQQGNAAHQADAAGPERFNVAAAEHVTAASPIPGFANIQPEVTGFPAPTIPGVPDPIVDPMAPLDLHASSQPPMSASTIPLISGEEAPIPGFANVAPPGDATTGVPGMNQPSTVPAAQPVVTVQPAESAPKSPSQTSAFDTRDAVVPSVASSDRTAAAPPQVGRARSAAAIAKSRGKSGITMPILVGIAVGLMLLVVGGVYFMFSGDRDESNVIAQTNPNANSPLVPDTVTTWTGSPDGLSSDTSRTQDNVPRENGVSSRGDSPGPADSEPGTTPSPMEMEDATAPSIQPPSSEQPTTETSMATPPPVSTEPSPTGPPAPADTTPMPTPAPPTMPQPSREDLVRLSSKLKSARAALVRHDFPEARSFAEEAASSAMSEVHQETVGRLVQMIEYAAGFQEAIVAGTTSLRAGEALQIKTTSVGIVETSADRIVLRVGGVNRRYELSNLPLGLAVAVAHQAVSPTDPTTIAQKACYVVTSPGATADDKLKARPWFMEAAAGLPEVADLAGVLDEDYDLVPGVKAPAVMPVGPAPSDTESKPTREEVRQLAIALLAARREIAARDWSAAQRHLATAEPLAKLAEHKEKLWRLQRLAEHVTAFDDAMKEALAALSPGDLIKVGSSTELTVERVNPATIAVEVAGLKKTYPLDNLPLGLAMALVQTRLAPEDPLTKAIQAAFVVVSKHSDDRSIAKARMWYEESGSGNPDFATLGKVIDDDYNLIKDFTQ